MQRLMQSSRRQRCSSRRPRERTSRRAPSRRWSARGRRHRTPQSEVSWDNASARAWSTSGAVLVGRTSPGRVKAVRLPGRLRHHRARTSPRKRQIIHLRSHAKLQAERRHSSTLCRGPCLQPSCRSPSAVPLRQDDAGGRRPRCARVYVLRPCTGPEVMHMRGHDRSS